MEIKGAGTLGVCYGDAARAMPDYAENDNHYFTRSEIAQLHTLLKPYIEAGIFSDLDFIGSNNKGLRATNVNGFTAFFIGKDPKKNKDCAYGLGLIQSCAYQDNMGLQQVRRALRAFLQVHFPEQTPAFSLV